VLAGRQPVPVLERPDEVGGVPTYREICDQVAAKGYAGMIIA
jgi:hypothetical protein